MKLLITAAVLAIAPAAAASAQSMPAPTFIKKAGASDLYEKQSSRLLLTSTRNGNLRRYANMMIHDHNKSTADVKVAAARAGLRVPPPRLELMQARDLAQLRAVRGPARDRLYVQQQQASHRMALQLHQGYATGGRVASLRRVAANTAPVVRHHLDEISSM